MPPPSPRDQRQQKRDKQAASVVENRSKKYTSLEDVHGSMFKDCMDGKKSPPDMTLEPKVIHQRTPIHPPTSQRPAQGKLMMPPRSGSSGSCGDANGGDGSGGDGSSGGRLAAALQRGGLHHDPDRQLRHEPYRQAASGGESSAPTSEGLSFLPTAAALYASGDNLLMRLGAHSTASCSSLSSGSEPVPGGVVRACVTCIMRRISPDTLPDRHRRFSRLVLPSS